MAYGTTTERLARCTPTPPSSNVARRRAFTGVNANVEIGALEEQDGYVVRRQGGLPVANIHANTIDDVLAVRFNDELPSRFSGAAEETPQRRLCARMQMQLGLLQKKYGRTVRAEQRREHRQHLTDPESTSIRLRLGPFLPLLLPNFRTWSWNGPPPTPVSCFTAKSSNSPDSRPNASSAPRSYGALRKSGSPLPWAASQTACTAARDEVLPVLFSPTRSVSGAKGTACRSWKQRKSRNVISLS